MGAVRRRQSAPPAVSPPPRHRPARVSGGRSRTLLRLLHRQLSRSADGENRPALHSAQLARMTSRLDLLLINPGSRIQVYQALGNELAAVEPPVWAGMMASFVRGRGRSVEILDAEAERLTPSQVAERVEAASPRL